MCKSPQLFCGVFLTALDLQVQSILDSTLVFSYFSWRFSWSLLSYAAQKS